MKISELIAKLQVTQTEHGDLSTCDDQGRTFDYTTWVLPVIREADGATVGSSFLVFSLPPTTVAPAA